MKPGEPQAPSNTLSVDLFRDGGPNKSNQSIVHDELGQPIYKFRLILFIQDWVQNLIDWLVISGVDHPSYWRSFVYLMSTLNRSSEGLFKQILNWEFYLSLTFWTYCSRKTGNIYKYLRSNMKRRRRLRVGDRERNRKLRVDTCLNLTCPRNYSATRKWYKRTRRRLLRKLCKEQYTGGGNLYKMMETAVQKVNRGLFSKLEFAEYCSSKLNKIGNQMGCI